MTHVISFCTDKFDIAKETPNPFNAIGGEGVLNWIRGKLEGTAYKATAPQTEDWGWYIGVEGNGANYLVGASGEAEQPIEWMVQIHKQRTLKEKLTGKNKMSPDDPLVALLEHFVRNEPSFKELAVGKEA